MRKKLGILFGYVVLFGVLGIVMAVMWCGQQVTRLLARKKKKS